MACDPQDKPLQVGYTNRNPPWRPARFDIWKWKLVDDYKGRDSWWTELGYVDPFVSKKVKRYHFPQLKEEDPFYYDPPVKDGESYSGPFSNDRKYTPNFTVKGYQIGDFYEFQKKVMKSSRQYQQIAKKWNLSKEHPGLEVNPTHNGLFYYTTSYIGRPLFLPSNYTHLGPRFWDKPLNEGCLEKGLCLTKYAAVLSVIYAMLHMKSYPPPNLPYTLNVRTIMRQCWKFLPMPCVMAFTAGSGLCTIAAIRKRDDFWNFLVLGPLLHLVYGTMRPKNVSVLTFIGMTAAVFYVGTCMQRTRYTWPGPTRTVQSEATSTYSGPLTWKAFNFGNSELPKEVF